MTLPTIHPGNVLPDTDRWVAVIAVDQDGKHPILVKDRRISKRSWMCWKHVIMWQELPPEEAENERV